MQRISATLGVGLVLMICGAVSADEPLTKGQVRDLRGRIVRVDPDKNIIVVRTGTGDAAKEMEYQIGKTTRYWGTDRAPLTDGLRYKGFREGTDVWYRLGTGDNRTSISELRFYDPSIPVPNPK